MSTLALLDGSTGGAGSGPGSGSGSGSGTGSGNGGAGSGPKLATDPWPTPRPNPQPYPPPPRRGRHADRADYTIGPDRSLADALQLLQHARDRIRAEHDAYAPRDHTRRAALSGALDELGSVIWYLRCRLDDTATAGAR